MSERSRSLPLRAADLIVASVVRALFALLRRLGPVRSSNLGGAVARGIGPHLPVSAVARKNLRAAFPNASAAWIERTLVEVWDNLGRTATEYPHLEALRRVDRLDPSRPGYVVEGEAHFAAAQASARPKILVSAHLANWEVLPVAAHAGGLTLGLIYRAVGNPRIDRIIRETRSRAVAGPATPLFPKGALGARQALAHLTQGGSLGILADQKMNDGIAVRFFGRDAMTAPAPALLALRHAAVVLPARAVREGPAQFRIIVDPPIPLPGPGSRADRARALTEAITARVEAWVRERPGQWLWLHRRWPKE